MARIKLPPVDPPPGWGTKSSKSRLKANKKWDDKHSRITIKVVPELKQDLEKYAKSQDKSVTSLLIDLIKKEIY